ncbi:MAG: ABC transporter substrate-binding protein, partial [Silanimonas sp.]
MNRRVWTTGRRAWHASAIALLALGASGCAETPPEPAPLRFGMDLWAGYFPAVIAEQQGLMAAEGVALKVTFSRDTKGLIAEFAAGHHDLVGVSLGDAITLSEARPDVVVLLVANESTGGDQILRSPRIDAASLDGDAPLRVATAMGGFGELFTQTWLQRANVDARRVTWSNVDASDVAAALREGRIDYGHTWVPYATAAVAEGATPVFSSAETPGLVLDVVVTTRETVQRHPEALRGFARAWFAASARWQADPTPGHAIAEAALGLPPGSATLDGLRLHTLAENRQLMTGGADAPLASLVNRYADFFVEHGSLSTPPQAERLF